MKTNEVKFGVAVVASIYEVENAISTEGASDVMTPAIIAKAIQSVLGVQGSDSVQEAKATGGDVTADR